MPEDEFSELDYRPKKRTGCLLPVLVIIVVVALIAVLIVFIGMRNEAQIDINGEPGPEQQEQEQDEEAVSDLPEPVADEEEATEEELEETEEDPLPPDYDRLEAALHGWLKDRVNDPDVIMVHTEELDDPEKFFELYNLAEDNVIVYMIESTDGQFASAVFGFPYSEWSVKTVFTWREDKWVFFREEDIQP